jgi:hypothetical protein
MKWGQEEKQLKCVFNKNYYSVGGESIIDVKELLHYFNKYAIPLTRNILKMRTNNTEISDPKSDELKKLSRIYLTSYGIMERK